LCKVYTSCLPFGQAPIFFASVPFPTYDCGNSATPGVHTPEGWNRKNHSISYIDIK
jgi:hypothetical protein